jgi:hypothetical protein
MRKLKRAIGHFPVVGYLLRLVLGIILLPRHLVGIRHAIELDKNRIKTLEDGLLRANRHIIELDERLEAQKKG